MRKWSKRWTLVVLLSLGQWLGSAAAQFPAPGSGEPQPMAGYPSAAGQPAAPPSNPFSLRNDGSPNAFDDDDGYRRPQDPYILSFRAEWLTWFVSQGRINQPLITTSLNPDIATDRGVFGQLDTSTLLSAGRYTYGPLQGGRMTVGIAPAQFIPIEVTGMWLGRSKDLFSFANNGGFGSQVIARPIQLSDITGQLNLPTEDVSLVNFPGVVAGQMFVHSAISVWGVEPNIFFPCVETDCLGLAAYVGYRYMNMSESLDIYTTTAPVGGTLLNFAGDPNGFAGPAFIGVTDRFNVVNQFNGGQVGARIALSGWRLTFSSDFKLALGCTNSQYSSEGQSTIFTIPGVVSLPGGLLAQPSNSASQNVSRFSIIPEMNLNLRFRITDNFNLLAGYNVFYWTSVLRAGDFIRRTLNSQEIPTDANFTPGFTPSATPASIHTSGFFAHGINFGIEIGF